MTGRHVLITGAAGRVGTLLRPRLARPDRRLRLLDIVAATPDPAEDGEDTGGRTEIVVASVTDLAAIREACRDVDAVVHLAGVPAETGSWSGIAEANIHGTQRVLEAARREGVTRVILASSNHAAGFWTREEAPPDGLPSDAAGRPDTYYGVSKIAMEALGSLYHSRFGMDVLCLRIGSCRPRPTGARALATWLSPGDAARLVESCLSAREPGFRVIWGISRNTRRWWSLAAGAEIGYHPVDDAEHFAAEILAHGPPTGPGDPELRLLGGGFCTAPLADPG